MANSPRGLPGDVRHPPFLPLIFCQRRGNFPPGAPDQGCKSRNIAIASLYRKQTEKPAASTHRRCPFRCDDLTSTMSSSTFYQAVSSHRRHPESSRFSGGARDLTCIIGVLKNPTCTNRTISSLENQKYATLVMRTMRNHAHPARF